MIPWILMGVALAVLYRAIRRISQDYKRRRHSSKLLDEYCYRERNGRDRESEPFADRGWKRTPARQSHPADWDDPN